MSIIGKHTNSTGSITIYIKRNHDIYDFMVIQPVFGVKDVLQYVPTMSEEEFRAISRG